MSYTSGYEAIELSILNLKSVTNVPYFYFLNLKS